MRSPLALVIEDDQALSRAYQRVLTELGYRVDASDNVSDARLKIRSTAPGLILVDIELPDGNGLDLMNELRNSTRERFIVISGNSSQRAAIKSIRHRAVKFVSKPVSLGELKQLIGEPVSENNVAPDSESDDKARSATSRHIDSNDCWINYGNSPALVDLRTAISFSAELRKGHALIVGEPGLDKRSIAVELHKRSRRSGKIVFVDCAEPSNSALKSKLFGSASSDSQGSIAAAVGGTLVLENVNALSDELQSTLSLFLDEGIFKHPDSEKVYKAITAVVGIMSDQAGLVPLKNDLQARLSQVTLNVPSLRECTGDALAIAQWLLNKIGDGQSDNVMSKSMQSQISQAPWSNNITELRNTIQAAVDYAATSPNSSGQLELPDTLQHKYSAPLTDLVGLTLREFNKQLVVATLAHHKGDKATTATTLGISLKTLYNRLNSH
ncbi:MAG: sigma-54-dependent transcriptional regulator [Granulosicoccus sp.]